MKIDTEKYAAFMFSQSKFLSNLFYKQNIAIENLNGLQYFNRHWLGEHVISFILLVETKNYLKL